MESINIITAFLGGLASFLSPCVLPLASGYIVYITGAMIEEDLEKKKLFAFKRTISFILGFTVVFVLLGVTASEIGGVLNIHRMTLLKVGGVLLIIIGLAIMGVLKFKIRGLNKKMPIDVKSNIGSFIVGMIFAIGWTPCVGAILGAILIFASNQDTAFEGGILLLIYSIGFSIPFLITALFIDRINTFWKKIEKYQGIISKAMGIFIIILGIMMFMDKLSILNNL